MRKKKNLRRSSISIENLDTREGTTSGTHSHRAFYDFANAFCDGMRDRSGILFTPDQYFVSPIILFKTFQDPTNDSNSTLISLDFKQAVTGCNIIVVGFGDENIKIDVDEYGKYTGFSVY